MNYTNTRGSCVTWLCAALLAAAMLQAAGTVDAQATLPTPAPEPAAPVTPVAEPAPAAGADPVAATASPAVVPDIKADLAALRAEINAFKAKQEEAEAAALLTQGEDSSATSAAAPDMLRVYGFMDFGIDKFFFSSQDDGLALLRPTPATTFVFGNLNLYFDATPVEHLRTMLEVRLTVAPHGEDISLGPPLGTSYERIDSTAFDFSSPSAQSQLRLGGLFIERAWSEYSFDELFKVQWGLFLNPFGIWNLDHGSPTLISLMLPTFISAQMVPTRLLGVHVHGSKFFGNSELGYALHISNGRSPLDFDLSEDKAVGARLFWSKEGDFGRLVLGASGYVGSYLDQDKTIAPREGSTFDWTDTIHYNEEVAGIDAAYDVGDLRLRAEGVLRWIDYKDGHHEKIFSTDGSAQYLPSRVESAAYLLAAYRTPWRIEPYIEVEYSSKSYTLPRYAGKSRATSANAAAITPSIGFNVELTTHTLFKTQFAYINVWDGDFKNTVLTVPSLFIRVVDSF